MRTGKIGMTAKQKNNSKMRFEVEDDLVKLMEALGAQLYKSARLPAVIRRGEIGKCFDWCAIQAIQNPQYHYVEGIAKPADSDEWILHAWLTDGEQAFDPTWHCESVNGVYKDIAPPVKYIGVEMDTMDIARFMHTTGYQGVIANRWRHPELADKCLKRVRSKFGV